MEVTRKYKVEKVEVVTTVDKTVPDGVTITLSEKDASNLLAIISKTCGIDFDDLFVRMYQRLSATGISCTNEQEKEAARVLSKQQRNFREQN